MQQSNTENVSEVLKWIQEPIFKTDITYKNPGLTFNSIKSTTTGWSANFTFNPDTNKRS